MYSTSIPVIDRSHSYSSFPQLSGPDLYRSLFVFLQVRYQIDAVEAADIKSKLRRLDRS